MLDRSAIRRILECHKTKMQGFLNLVDWCIDVDIDTTFPYPMGANFDLVAYKHATITVNPDMYEDEEGVVNNLFHEMSHIIHGDFYTYRKAMQGHAHHQSDKSDNAESTLWQHASEGTVLRLEWIWRNHLRDLYLDIVTAPDEEN